MKFRNLLCASLLMVSNFVSAQLPTAGEIAAKMYPGWNLGNTMEANNNGTVFTNNVGLNGEISWQSTKTSKELIDYVKSLGFKSVRIPCNWVCGHISNAADNTIDAEWMARVKEIVDYCVDAGLYVVLNDHYDGGWVETSFGSLDEATVSANCLVMNQIWTQIANTFKDYDEHLLFAGLNEPNVDNQSKTDVLVRYEQAFIDAVRATGGNNSSRTLIVQGPSTDIDNTNKYFNTLPEDDIEGRLMVEVHYYSPAQFTGVWENGSPYYFWGAANHVTSGTYKNYNSTWGEESYMKEQFKKMATKFVDKGYPVILGEYGANWRKIDNTAAQKKHDASIKLFHKCAVQYAVECGMVPFVWDINVANQNGTTGIMTVVNRGSLQVFSTPAMEGITEAVQEAKWGASTGIVNVVSDGMSDANAPLFNLSGQRVVSNTRGLIITKNRKYFKK